MRLFFLSLFLLEQTVSSREKSYLIHTQDGKTVWKSFGNKNDENAILPNNTPPKYEADSASAPEAGPPRYKEEPAESQVFEAGGKSMKVKLKVKV